MSNTTLEAIEANIKESRKAVELGEALERLQRNRDFRAVIGEGYFTKEAVRLVHLKADANMQSADQQKAIVSQMDAIGSLSLYFRTVTQQASLANKAIASDEATREEILEEGGAE